jgi:hypothetical protein
MWMIGGGGFLYKIYQARLLILTGICDSWKDHQKKNIRYKCQAKFFDCPLRTKRQPRLAHLSPVEDFKATHNAKDPG